MNNKLVKIINKDTIIVECNSQFFIFGYDGIGLMSESDINDENNINSGYSVGMFDTVEDAIKEVM